MERTSTPPSPEDDFDPDDYIRTAVTYGRLDVVKDWLPHHRDDPQRISQLVLFPAAMFGQLELLIFCLDYGDMNHREEHHPVYRGWNLTHFAVKGIHMNVHVPAEENQQNGQLCGEENVLRTKLEIHSRLLDILAVLLSRGVDPTVPDCEGNTASGKASSLSSREECFLDGAVLLDIHVCTHSLESGGSPKTPGLEALKKLPEDLQWQLALQPLLEWAYSRNRFDVLTFCHKNRFVDLTQKKMCLGQSGRPLMIDSLHTQRFSLLREMIQSSSDIDPCVCAQKLLTKVYECGPRKETLLSYATRAATSGNASLLPSLLSPETLGVHLSHIKIEGVNLETVPLSLFTPSLAHLELSKNQLSTLPVGDAIDRGLCDRLEELSIAGNAFSEFPGDIFRLPRLVRLDARNNVISSVPVSMWTAPRLEELYLSKNNVACLPCPDYVYLRPGVTASVQSRLMTFSHGFSSTETRHVQSARQSCVTLAAPGAESQGEGFRLKTLDLSDNQLTEIPPGLPCLAPRLRTLKLSGNLINHLGHPCNYPQMLEKLDMNKNASKSCIQWCGDPPSLVCAQSRLREGSEPCSHIGHKVLSNLKFLFLEENQLTSVELEEQQPIRHRNSIESVSDFGSMGDSGTHGGERDGGGEVLMTLMFPRLESLRLSNNQLERVPSGIHRVVELRELKLDGNTGITRLPSNIHLLQELFFFTFEGISDPVVSELRSCSNTPEQLLYLKAREKDYCRNTAMRLFVIGHFSKGKTSVIGALRKTKQLRTFDERAGRHLDPDYHLTEDERQSTVGIQCDRWVYKKAGATTQVTFYTWDFAGQEEYYLTHQCFFTNRALYLLVWSVTDGVEGIKSLTVWLQNLQAKAPGSSVIVVGTHMDLVPRTEREEKARVWLDMVNWYNSNRAHSHLYPHIMGTCFVGIPQKGKVSGVHGPDSLADFIYDVAMKMEVPNGPHVGGASVKMMQEMIPVAYETLRQEIERLQEDVWSKQVPPVMNRDTFWSRMSETVGLDNTAMEAAVDFLHASTGMILHFQLPHLIDHYIIDPQYWFDLCALVISPSNVSQLIQREGIISRSSAQLEARLMDQALERQELGCSKTTGNLLRQFLMEHGVIHQIDSENYLVPSAINPDPSLPLHLVLGHFPHKSREVTGEPAEPITPSPYHAPTPMTLSLVGTGLVYRRTLHLPPIASGFWSKLISLCIQHDEILRLLSAGSCGYEMHVTTNRLRGMLGNVGIEWQYWKTGIILIADEKLLLRVNSLRRDVFVDPRHQFVVSSALAKVQNFQLREGREWTSIPEHLNEVIEIIVPQMVLEESGSKSLSTQFAPSRGSVAAKLLAKVLELIDEILKNHCEHLAMNGIYTVGDMLHLVPCPLCYGDSDNRTIEEADGPHGEGADTPKGLRRAVTTFRRGVRNRPDRALSKSLHVSASVDECPEALYAFRVDECIQQTMVSDCMSCPRHGRLEIAHLAPDIAFVDLAFMKLDHTRFNEPIDPNESSNLRGSFAKVVKRHFDTRSQEGSIEVAIKIFVQQDSVQSSSAFELAKNYADMRYELNKLSTMSHGFVVRFVGVLTNPLCFVLEWAPGKSLEHVRKIYVTERSSICPTTLFLVLLQVIDALSYLHEAVKIIHNDLRCSNILVFRFPPANHHCLTEGATSGCGVALGTGGVLVKVADMGICANPATQKTKNKQGIRQFVPECLNYNASLTNKVDIFYLGTCLYELMSLRPLPPADISEAEYRNMLKIGKRASFSTKDTPYPSFLYQVLEECWQQEQYRRPSAELLHSALTELTGLAVRPGSSPAQSSHSLLLDSFVLYHSCRLSAVHSLLVDGEEGSQQVVMCGALSSLANNSTSIVSMTLGHHQESLEYTVETKSLWSVGPSSVCVVHATAGGLVLAALADGQVMVFNTANKTRFLFQPAQTCSELHGKHSEIVAMSSLPSPPFLLMGFACGRVHVYSWSEGVNEVLRSPEDHHCTYIPRIHTISPLHSLLSLHTASGDGGEGVLSVWCGTSASSLVVLDYPLTPNTVWGLQYDVERVTSIVPLANGATSHEFTAKELKSSGDGTCVLALLHQPGSQTSSLALVDSSQKTLLRLVTCDMSVSSLSVTPSQLVLGTYQGHIHLFDWHRFHSTRAATLRAEDSESLLSHDKAVYSVVCVAGGTISPNGLTTFTPTFVGKSQTTVSKEFLISVGNGKHPVITANKTTTGLFRSFTLTGSVCLNVWMI